MSPSTRPGATLGIRQLDTARRESGPARRRDLLDRAQAYAEAALRDFRYYQSRAPAAEAKAQQLIDTIAQAIAAPPPAVDQYATTGPPAAEP